MKDPTPLILLLLLSLAVVYGFLLVAPPSADLHGPGQQEEGCSEGLSRPCSVGPCNGTSVCRDGSWSLCRWDKVCQPGERAPCIESGCVRGFKECDECGTAYGPCPDLSSAQNCTYSDNPC